MSITIIDPSVLIYAFDDWHTRQAHCYQRFEALLLHRDVIVDFKQHFAISDRFYKLVWSSFPWKLNQSIPELRDLVVVIRDLFNRGSRFVNSDQVKKVCVKPENILCQYVNDAMVIEAWNDMLSTCLNYNELKFLDLQIATWDSGSLNASSAVNVLARVEANDDNSIDEHQVNLVWNPESWLSRILTLPDWSNNLNACVKLYFCADNGIHALQYDALEPDCIECSTDFNKALKKQYKSMSWRRTFIKQLSKMAYGIRDRSLNDEAVQGSPGLRRFRVQEKRRVHYKKKTGKLMLEQIGEHRIGRIG